MGVNDRQRQRQTDRQRQRQREKGTERDTHRAVLTEGQSHCWWFYTQESMKKGEFWSER